jgi:hypothetical protein
VAASLAVLVAAGALSWQLAHRGPGGGDDVPVAVRDALTVTARDAIEGARLSPLAPKEGRLACAVRLIGTEPVELSRVADARHVYVWADCQTIGTETPTGSSVPVAVHLSRPRMIEVPRDGGLNLPDTQRMFPARLWDDLQQRTFADDGASAELARRVAERS